MTTAARFKAHDIRRAVKSVEGLGYEEVRVCIGPDGTIEVIVRRAVAHDAGQDLD